MIGCQAFPWRIAEPTQLVNGSVYLFSLVFRVLFSSFLFIKVHSCRNDNRHLNDSRGQPRAGIHATLVRRPRPCGLLATQHHSKLPFRSIPTPSDKPTPLLNNPTPPQPPPAKIRWAETMKISNRKNIFHSFCFVLLPIKVKIPCQRRKKISSINTQEMVNSSSYFLRECF